jgi:Gram-negative bacterial TonB protein C-terminal
MKSNQANLVGLISPLQQAEMKSILAGTWPPLKPLPVFKLEADEYRATIDFDKVRGEWVCRQTSFPSNAVQEFRGALREITMALRHGESEVFIEGAEQQERELDKDALRRLHTLLEWQENYENGALYFELRNYLSESQQVELDDSLRLSLTARQLQFNSKNVAFVFEALSTAGGRLATLIEIARQKKAGQGTGAHAQPQASAPGRGITYDKPPLQIISGNSGPILRNSLVRAEQAAVPCTGDDNFPVDSIRRVFAAQEQTPSASRTTSPSSEIAPSRILVVNSPVRIDGLQETASQPAPVSGFPSQVQTGEVKSSADRSSGSSPHFRILEISGFQIAAFAFVILSAVVGLAGGFTALRGRLGKHFGNTKDTTMAVGAPSPANPDHHVETSPPTSTPPAVNNARAADSREPEKVELQGERSATRSRNTEQLHSAVGAKSVVSSLPAASPSVVDSDPSAEAGKLNGRTPFEEISKESDRDPEPGVLSRDSIPSPATASKPPANPESSPEPNLPSELTARNAPPPAGGILSLLTSPGSSTIGTTRNTVPRKATPPAGAAPHSSRPSAILVTTPAHGSKPFRVIFPEKAIAASSSFAVSSQLSVLVSPQPGPARKPARLQGGELVSFAWPRYPRPRDRYASAETIKVRAIIGSLGQVLEVKLVSGSVSLLPATIRAIRQWHYAPTRLNAKPVQAQQDITIEFRPPQYSSEVSTQHPPRN